MSADEQDELLRDDDEIMSGEDEYEHPDGSQELEQELEQELNGSSDFESNEQQVQQREEEEGAEEEGAEEEGAEVPTEGQRDCDIEQDEVKEEKGAKEDENGELGTGANMPAYIIFNRSAYGIPLAGNGSESGRVRDHCSVIVVENDTVLGQLHNAKSWPASQDIPPVAIVVVKGRHDESQEIPKDKRHGIFHWYARVVSANNKDSEDRNILRAIPKQLVIQILHNLAKNESMKKSSLITHYQPFEHNSRVFPMQQNDWVKVPGIKSTAKARVTTKKKADTAQDAEEDVVESVENEQSTKRSNPETASESEKKQKVEKDNREDQSGFKEDKKAKQATASHTPSLDGKKTVVKNEKPEVKKVKHSSEMKGSVKRGSMLEFTRVGKNPNGASTSAAAAASPTSQRSSLAPRSPIQSRSPAPSRPRATPSAPAPTPAPAPAAASAPAPASAPASAPAPAPAPFRLLTKVSTLNKEKVHLFWDSNDLWVGEMN